MRSAFWKKLTALVLAGVLSLSMAGCGGSADSVSGSAAAQADDGRVYAAAGGTITLPEGLATPEAGSMNTQFADGQLAGAFTLTNYNTTGYFSTSGTLTLTIQGTLETGGVETQYTDAFVSLWKQGDGDTTYQGSVYFTADGTPYTYTWSGLEAGAQYRITVAYNDVTWYDLTGTFVLTGVTAEGETDLATNEG